MAYTLGNYKVYWKYDPIKKENYCIIDDVKGKNIVSEKVLIENYDKLTARRDSFRKAMRKVAALNLLDKEIRRAIWTKFNEFIKQPN